MNTNTSANMQRFAVWMPTTKEELRALVQQGQPKRAVAEAWMMAEYERTCSSFEGCAAYDEVMLACGYEADAADMEALA